MSSDTSPPSSSPSSQRRPAGSDNPQSMTTVAVGQEKCSEVASPSSHTVRPKRILPENLVQVLEPGAEYTPWGDLMWELYGLEDGTLSNGPLPEKVLQNWSEWRDRFAKAPWPIRKNRFPRWKWPLTHKERVEELEALLRDETLKRDFDNIRAAIEFHKEFDPDTFCKPTIVNFQHGRQLGPQDQLTAGPRWVEGCKKLRMKNPGSIIGGEDPCKRRRREQVQEPKREMSLSYQQAMGGRWLKARKR